MVAVFECVIAGGEEDEFIPELLVVKVFDDERLDGGMGEREVRHGTPRIHR